jgi:predicted GNAT family acetyltransferase
VPPQATVIDNRERSRYEATVAGDVAGYAEYRLGERTIIFTHTVVDHAHEGKGLASQLVRFALDDARTRGLRVRPQCPFFAKYIATHRAYADLVS